MGVKDVQTGMNLTLVSVDGAHKQEYKTDVAGVVDERILLWDSVEEKLGK